MAERTRSLRPAELLKYAFFAVLAGVSIYYNYASYLDQVASAAPGPAMAARPSVSDFDAAALTPAATAPVELDLPPPARSLFDYAPAP